MDTSNLAPPRQNFAIAVTAAMLVVAAIAVGLRFYTRYAVLKNVCVDDWAVVMAYVRKTPLSFSLLVQRWLNVLNTILDPYPCMRDCDSLE
jgi:hypothetical protein